jgi:hypothetical protein
MATWSLEELVKQTAVLSDDHVKCGSDPQAALLMNLALYLGRTLDRVIEELQRMREADENQRN